jgi:hypothetical protein
MLEEKRKDLDAEKKKKLLHRFVEELSSQDPDLYYRATADIARLIKARIDRSAGLSLEDRELLQGITQRDIEVLLSIH